MSPEKFQDFQENRPKDRDAIMYSVKKLLIKYMV